MQKNVVRESGLKEKEKKRKRKERKVPKER